MPKDTKPEQIVKARRKTYQLIFKCSKNKITLNISSAARTPGNSGVTNFKP